MGINQTFEKRRLIIILGENGAPAGGAWEGVVFTKNDDGSDAAPPFTKQYSASEDDVAKHISQAALDQNTQLVASITRVGELTEQVKAQALQIAKLSASMAEMSNATAVLTKIHDSAVARLAPAEDATEAKSQQ